MKNNFERKKQLVLAGKSKVFNDWHKQTGISAEEFLQGLEWVCDDEEGLLQKELGITEDGKLHYLRRCYNALKVDGKFSPSAFEFSHFAELANGETWTNGVSISARDSI